MKNLFYIIIIAFICVSCETSTPQEKIENLNGYWEIKSAKRPGGVVREYKMSSFIDYIEIEDGKGFRKKVSPKITGGFIATEDQETLRVKVENDSINLYYTTPFDSWKETLLSSEENEIVILNPEGIIYTYKRFTPYLEDNGKEN